MKTIKQVSTECNIGYKSITNTIMSQDIILIKINGKCYIDEFQENYLHRILYFEGKINEITLESKINKK